MRPKPATCQGCVLYGTGQGFVPASGDGTNGVLIVLEAAGEQEAHAGIPLVGRAGQYFWSQLLRVGLSREGFRVHNVLSCRPPNNVLVGAPYEQAAIAHCAGHLDATLRTHDAASRAAGLTPVVLALGKVAARALMGWPADAPEWGVDTYGYVHWSPTANMWVIVGPHPAAVMRGQHALANVLQFCAQRAVEIARCGFAYDQPRLRTDLFPDELDDWVDTFLAAQAERPGEVWLSYDIETPWKQHHSEELLPDHEDTSFYILRWGLCWQEGEAISVPGHPSYLGGLTRLFSSGAVGLNWNGELYDNVRIRAAIPTFNLHSMDVMLAWHVLHSSLPKSLGFVTPFYWPGARLWKHEASSHPARYNALDALATWRCWAGIRPHLEAGDLYPVFERHVLRVNHVLRYMTGKGVAFDAERRFAAEQRLLAEQARLMRELEAAVPLEARTLRPVARQPADTTGYVQVPGTRRTTRCTRCGALDVRAAHTASLGRKRLSACLVCGKTAKAHPTDHPWTPPAENPCLGAVRERVEVPAQVWAQVMPLTLSTKTLLAYQRVRGHRPMMTREGRPSFDEGAVMRLAERHPQDPLYQRIVAYRRVQTLLSRYIGRAVQEPVVVPDDYVLQPGEVWVP